MLVSKYFLCPSCFHEKNKHKNKKQLAFIALSIKGRDRHETDTSDTNEVSLDSRDCQLKTTSSNLFIYLTSSAFDMAILKGSSSF